MFKKWTGIERLITDLIPSLLPVHSGGSPGIRQASDSANRHADDQQSSSRPTWLIPAYLRQQRSGDRISRWH